MINSNLKAYENHVFESGIRNSKDFLRFARLFRNEIRRQLPDGAKLDMCNTGHFYVSGFIERQGRFVYFSISDVRHFRNSWYTNILIRQANHNTDFTGGHNHYTSLNNFRVEVTKLLEGGK